MNVERRKGRKGEKKHKFESENDIPTTKERIKQRMLVNVQWIRKFEKRKNFYRKNELSKTGPKTSMKGVNDFVGENQATNKDTMKKLNGSREKKKRKKRLNNKN